MVSAQVRSVLIVDANLIGDAVHKLNTSEHSLQRKLKEEQISFQK